jgi:hypothetical protein
MIARKDRNHDQHDGHERNEQCAPRPSPRYHVERIVRRLGPETRQHLTTGGAKRVRDERANATRIDHRPTD